MNSGQEHSFLSQNEHNELHCVLVFQVGHVRKEKIIERLQANVIGKISPPPLLLGCRLAFLPSLQLKERKGEKG